LRRRHSRKSAWPSVLLREQHDLAVVARARRAPRVDEQHQGQQPEDLRLLRQEPHEQSPETDRLGAEVLAHQLFAGARRVALVEDEVDDLEHRREPGGAIRPPGDLEGDAGRGQGPLGADDALGDGRLRHQVGASDLGGGEAAENPER
jgi:hypothetical protein